ncbi:YbaK/EbsC family protein [Gallaecimonas mangrovi]|uniref:YbaK/EbsC family protein n=1 Tax=Gallaecimonas mangrovi TaxID=2291597 RepID=UPI000E205CBD|nr:YbaK/EbsC family protein [Gallaecimonas mangrovi]
MPTLSASATKVQQFLAAKGVDMDVVELPGSTRTAKEAASTLGCAVAQIAKSLIFKDAVSGLAVLIVASGSNRVDVAKVEAATGLTLEKADADFVRTQTGFAIGGVPPVAHANPVITLLDTDLKKYPQLWAAAGTPHAVFPLKAADLSTLTDGRWLVIA